MKKVNRIISPVLCALIFPIMYYLPIVKMFVSSSLLKNDDGTTKNLLSYIGFKRFMSIDFFVGIIKGESSNELLNAIVEGFKKSDADLDIKSIVTSIDWLYVFGIFTALFLVLMIAVAVLTAIGKKVEKAAIATSVTSIVCAGGAYFCFYEFARPFLRGYINLSTILGSINFGDSDSLSGISSLLSSLNISGLITNAMSFDEMSLSIAFIFAFLIAVLVLGMTVTAHIMKD